MRHPIPACMVLAGAAFAGGCPAAEPVMSTATDGGTWTVSLLALPEEAGHDVLELAVDPAGDGADGALATAIAAMPSMGHSSEGAVDGDGPFEVAVFLSMSGWWVLDGTVVPAGDPVDSADAEAFRLEFEVP